MVAQHVEPSSDLRQLRDDFGLSRERMARLLDVSSKTIERWEAQPPRASSRVLRLLARLHEIRDLGLIVYKPEGFRILMKSPLPDLDGLTPLQAIELGRADDVFGALAGDYEGLGF